MRLFRRAAAAVALHIGLSDSHSQIVIAAMFENSADAREIFCPEVFIHLFRDQMQREKTIGADFLDQYDQGVAEPRRAFNQPASLEKIFGSDRNFEITAVVPAIL